MGELKIVILDRQGQRAIPTPIAELLNASGDLRVDIIFAADGDQTAGLLDAGPSQD